MPNIDEILSGGSAAFRRLNAGLARVLRPDAPGKATAHHDLDAGVPNKIAKRDAAPALDGVSKAQAGGVATAPQRPRVVITLFRFKLLDAEAKYGSAKPLLDGLVAAGLIPDDNDNAITLLVEQVKVPKSQEGAGVVIYYNRLP